MIQHCFVLGCSGSGKSLLAGVLRSLDGVAHADERILPTCLAHLVRQPIDPGIVKILARGVAKHLEVYAAAGPMYSRANAAAQFAVSNIPFSELVKALLGKRLFDLFLFESNFFAFAPGFLAQVAPDARWIFVMRDGRDCAHLLEREYQVLTDEKLRTLNSSEMPIGRLVDDRHVPWWVEIGHERDFLAASTFGRAIWMWRELVRTFDQFRQAAGSGAKVVMVRYEDLTAAPEKIVSSLAKDLQKTLNPLARRKSRRLHSRNIGLHKIRSRHELEEAESIARPELRLLGYI